MSTEIENNSNVVPEVIPKTKLPSTNRMLLPHEEVQKDCTDGIKYFRRALRRIGRKVPESLQNVVQTNFPEKAASGVDRNFILQHHNGTVSPASVLPR